MLKLKCYTENHVIIKWMTSRHGADYKSMIMITIKNGIHCMQSDYDYDYDYDPVSRCDYDYDYDPVSRCDYEYPLCNCDYNYDLNVSMVSAPVHEYDTILMVMTSQNLCCI